MSDSGFQVDADAPRHYQDVAVFMVPLAESLVAAGVKPGEAVLDVACGTGIATRIASGAAGPDGHVTGSDINADMVRFARSGPSGGAGVTWDIASALDLPYGDASFDSVICQQGIQFFPDIVAGLQEMARVTRPGGSLCATVWSGLADSPFFAAELEMLSEYCGTDRSVYASAYIEGGPSEMAAWFRLAGLENVSVELLEPVVSLPPVRTFVPRHLMALPWSGSFFELDERTRHEALSVVEDALAGYTTEQGIDVPFRSYLGRATV
jgi:SAM-dependent methyltransferase